MAKSEQLREGYLNNEESKHPEFKKIDFLYIDLDNNLVDQENNDEDQENNGEDLVKNVACNEVKSKGEDKNLNLTIDLHGFTRYSAKNCIIRAIKSMNLTDTSYKTVFITGMGNHSTGKTPILDSILTNVATTFECDVSYDNNLGRPYLLKKPTNHQMLNNQKKKQRPSTYKKGK